MMLLRKSSRRGRSANDRFVSVWARVWALFSLAPFITRLTFTDAPHLCHSPKHVHSSCLFGSKSAQQQPLDEAVPVLSHTCLTGIYLVLMGIRGQFSTKLIRNINTQTFIKVVKRNLRTPGGRIHPLKQVRFY